MSSFDGTVLALPQVTRLVGSAGSIENGKGLRVVLAVSLIVASSLYASSSGLAEDPPPSKPPASPAMEDRASTVPGEMGSLAEASEVRERAGQRRAADSIEIRRVTRTGRQMENRMLRSSYEWRKP